MPSSKSNNRGSSSQSSKSNAGRKMRSGNPQQRSEAAKELGSQSHKNS